MQKINVTFVNFFFGRLTFSHKNGDIEEFCTITYMKLFLVNEFDKVIMSEIT